MSEIKKTLQDALEYLGLGYADDPDADFWIRRSIACSLYVLANDIHAIRRAVEGLDEVEEMYKDYPADSDWERWRKNE